MSSSALASTGGGAAAPRVVSRLNPANAVTASRFLTLPPFLWAVHHGYYQTAFVAIVVCGLLDKVDGQVAKFFNCRSAFGEVFDAIADGVCYGFCLITVAVYGWAPWLPVVLTLGLGAVNSGFRAIYVKRAGRTVNYKSYAMERLVGFIAYMVGFAVAQYQVGYYFWTLVPLLVVVVVHDARRMLRDPIPPAVPAAAASAGAA